MRFLYNTFINLYHFFAILASFFNPKIKLFVKGRKETWKRIREIENFENPIWFHCASLGEFEQARPLIEKIKKDNPDQKILLTFFSPSGYEIRKNYPFADQTLYLPVDTLSNARRFVDSVRPRLAIFVKYEFWYNFLFALNENHVKTYFISVILRKEQYFFKPYAGWAVQHLKNVSHFFVQDKESEELLKSIGISQVTITGDTRFDRVIEISRQAKSFEVIEKFKSDSLLMVAGSSWSQDEKLLAAFYKNYKSKTGLPRIKVLIAPHHPGEHRLTEIENLFRDCNVCRLSKIHEVQKEIDILIIDNIGMLSSLYKYSDFTYVGGGFGVAVHNTLECAVFGMPLFFGPNYHKFREIHDLIAGGCAHPVENAEGLFKHIENYIFNKALYDSASQSAKQYVYDNAGATLKILGAIL